MLTRRRKSSEPFVPLSLDFRRVYGSLLAVSYTQTIAVVLVSMLLGFVITLNSSHVIVGNINLSVTAGAVLGGLVVGYLAFKSLICKPQGLDPAKAFCQGMENFNLGTSLVYIVGTFCCVMALNFTSRSLLNLIPNFPHGLSNPGQVALMQAVHNTNAVVVCVYAVIICVVAPVVSELLFRGLLYGWMRNRFGVPVAIAGSSFAFACWQLDPVGFFQYLGLGLVLCIVYERTRCLPIVVAAHALWNITMVTIGALLIAH
jgi:membrane protease YdiL (CAAX protease family)